jgi:hypothetical protein
MLWYFKLSFYVNSHIDMLFGRQKRVSVVVRMDDGHETAVRENDDDG